MFKTFFLAALAAVGVVTASSVNGTADAASERAVWLCSATYCDPSTYLTREFTGPTAGFVATYSIHDDKSDTTGYIGYLPSASTIYVVFRGSSSIRNWISDLNAFKTAYTTYPDCNCEVHKGFFDAEQKVAATVVAEVQKLKSRFPGYSVTVTGHSLGAALSHLMAMDVYKAGISCDVINFGMPRVGTQDYSAFANARLPTKRYVHNRDEVPHLPLEEYMSFYHVCLEYFEDESGSIKTCDKSCEDPSCSDQFQYPSETNGEDHGYYLGLHLTCDSVSKK